MVYYLLFNFSSSHFQSWALVFWSLSFLTRVKVFLGMNSFPWFIFTPQLFLFSFSVCGLWSLGHCLSLKGLKFFYTLTAGLLSTLQLSLLVSSLWALVFWSLSFLIRVNVLLDINSWFTINSSTFSVLISSLWALVSWSLFFS